MERPRARDAAGPAAVLAAALALRWPALRGDLWLDEVWSLRLVRGAAGLRGVFFGIHHDNSTLLNALWLRAVSGSDDPRLLRAASLAAGLATVALLARDDEDAPRGLLAGALAALSVPLVLYATEARGYATMMLIAVAAWRLLPRPGASSPRRAAAFAAVAALGMFAHPLFVCALAAFAAEAAVRAPRGCRLRSALTLTAPAAALYASYLLLQDGRTVFGAGAFSPFGDTLLRALASWSGAPLDGPWAWAGAAAVAALAGAELARLARARDPEAVFHGTLFAANAAFVAAFPFRYERHFVLSLPFALMFAARTLARLLRGGTPARAAALALLALHLGGSAVRLRALWTDGRGDYRGALAEMARATAGSVVTVASDHDFRNPALVEYHAPLAAPEKTFAYVPGGGGAASGPEWYLMHFFATDPRVAPVTLTFRGGERFERTGFYPYAGLSGWSWAAYRRAR